MVGGRGSVTTFYLRYFVGQKAFSQEKCHFVYTQIYPLWERQELWCSPETFLSNPWQCSGSSKPRTESLSPLPLSDSVQRATEWCLNCLLSSCCCYLTGVFLQVFAVYGWSFWQGSRVLWEEGRVFSFTSHTNPMTCTFALGSHFNPAIFDCLDSDKWG